MKSRLAGDQVSVHLSKPVGIPVYRPTRRQTVTAIHQLSKPSRGEEGGRTGEGRGNRNSAVRACVSTECFTAFLFHLRGSVRDLFRKSIVIRSPSFHFSFLHSHPLSLLFLTTGEHSQAARKHVRLHKSREVPSLQYASRRPVFHRGWKSGGRRPRSNTQSLRLQTERGSTPRVQALL